jgi:hypothetical protein
MAEGFEKDWIIKNQEVIKCRTFAATDAVFSAYMAAIHYAPNEATWWLFAENAIDAVAQIYACQAPPPAAYEEAFGGENKRCQCAEVGGQLFLEWLDAAGNRTTLSNSEAVEAKQIKDAAIADGVASCNWLTVAGETRLATYDIQDGSKPIWYIVPTLDTECCSGSPIIPVAQPNPPPQIYPEAQFDGCNVTVELIDSCMDRFGLMQNYYKVTIPSECNPGQPTFRYTYWESVRGPIIYKSGTWDSFEGFSSDPIYAPPHPHAALPMVGGGTTSLSAVTYTLDVGCTYNPETDDFDTKYKYDVEATDDGIFGLSRRMDALAWMVNNAQLIPYTSCANQKPVLEGQWVTTRWESDKKMDHSGRRLRKLFRYRTKSTRDLGQLSAYWEDFTWEAGDVCVIHKGSWWGTPQVWAKSAEEGQRVIRHASAEAGLDPDQVGGWEISSSRSPRYGMSGTMKILKKEGFPWAASRDGANYPNYLAQSHDP